MQSMLFSSLTGVLALLAIAACDRGSLSDNAPTETTASVPTSGYSIEKKFVAATDEIGAGLNGVSSVAFWSHPGINFNSLVIAGHEDGITAFNIEDGAEVTNVTGFKVLDIAVSYIGLGPTAIGYLAVVTDDSENPMRFYEINNEDRSFKLLSTIFVAQTDETTALCLGSLSDQDNLVAVQSFAKGTTFFPLRFSTAGVSTQGGFSSTLGTVDCAVNSLNQIAYSITPNGDLIKFSATQNGTQTSELLIGMAVKDPKAMDISIRTNEEGLTNTILIVLNSTGFAQLFEITGDDSYAIGSIGMRDTFDVIALETATSLAIGFGNYGGIYREGILAFVDGNDSENAGGAPIKLAPWTGVVKELNLPVGGHVSPRGQIPALDEDEAVISIDLIQP